MKIALLGYGKMGRMIESIAVSRGHEITARIDGYTENIDFAGADVSIDFSVPSSAVHHITSSVDAGIPVVSGTTGWTEKMPEVRKLVEEKSGALVYSSNFSLGVNIFFELNRYLARLIQPYPQYELSISETHHIHKLDAPSGTAITLAEDITGENGRYTGWALETDDRKINENIIGITAVRQGEVPGTHTVTYVCGVDSIEICHTAFSREGFALGAVTAAEWLFREKKKGVFSMRDVLFSKR